MFLSPWYPYPPDNGSKVRIFNLLRELSTHHEITLLSFVDPEDQPGEESPMRTMCERVRVFPRPTRNGAKLMSLGGYVSPTPRHLVTTHSPQMSQAVQTELRRERYDALVASQRRMVPYAAPISGLPKVWEEVETTVIREAPLLEHYPLRRLRRKLTWAKEFGATHTINASSTDPVEEIRKLTGGNGVNVAIEAVGNPITYEQAFYARDHAGTVVLVGVPSPDMKIELPLIEVFGRGGSLKSSWYGDCLPSRDFPMLIDLYLQGRLDLDRFVTETIKIEDVEEAFHKMERGEVLRSVVVF